MCKSAGRCIERMSSYFHGHIIYMSYLRIKAKFAHLLMPNDTSSQGHASPLVTPKPATRQLLTPEMF